jgi:flagella basal body P-ring formation protein FlgA
VPKNASCFKVPSLKIITPFKEHNITLIDNQKSIVLFDRECHIEFKKEQIIKNLKKRFLSLYPSMKIEKLTIKPVSGFGKDFKDVWIKDIFLSKSALRKNSGTFFVVYGFGRSYTKRVYFRFELKANLELFKAKNNMHNGKILTENDVIKQRVTFKKIPDSPITKEYFGIYETKSYIRKDKIITSNMLKKASILKRDDIIRAVIRDGALKLEFEAIALESGNIGDIIKIKKRGGKVFRAKVVSKKEVIVQ